MIELAILAVAAAAAGFVDAVAGGGGLIQVPALFTLLPTATPAAVFGTNKLASIFGTGNAAWCYSRRIRLPWGIVGSATAAALVASYFGAAAVLALPKELVRPLVLALLVLVFVYTGLRPGFGREGGRGVAAGRGPWVAVLAGGVLGFYDGFFGPGTGSFLIFALVWLFGFDFVKASSAAKFINFASNAGALVCFAPHGQVLWAPAMVMAVFNILGATLGARLVLARGAGVVRWLFLAVTAALIGKFGYDTLFR